MDGDPDNASLEKGLYKDADEVIDRSQEDNNRNHGQKGSDSKANQRWFVDGYERHIPNDVEASSEIGERRRVRATKDFFLGLPIALDPPSSKKLTVMSDQRPIFK